MNKEDLIKEVWVREKFPGYSPTDMLHVIDILENTLLVPSDIDIFKHLQLLKKQTQTWEDNLSVIVNAYDDEILKADGFDDAIIGIEEGSHRLIYSVARCISILMADDMSEEDALDYFHYNVAGSYVGDKTPIWCNDMF